MNWFGVLDCIYSAEGEVVNGDRKTVISLGKKSRACFGDVIRTIRGQGEKAIGNITYVVYFRSGDYKGSNRNLLSLKEIRQNLKSLQKIVPFDYKLGYGECYKAPISSEIVPCNVIKIKMLGKVEQHIFITTMLRILFEYPYNVIGREVMNIKNKNIECDGVHLGEISWINLYFIVAPILGSETGHGVCDRYQNPKLKTYQDFSDELKKGKSGSAYSLICDGNRIKWSAHIGSYAELHSSDKFMERCKLYAACYKEKQSW